MPTFASSNGYLDTPAKYREIAEQQKEMGGFNNKDDFEEITRLQIAGEYFEFIHSSIGIFLSIAAWIRFILLSVRLADRDASVALFKVAR